MKKLNKKGFTLAELLVVIAIIAILVAIAVPIFTGALENARIARDTANVRSAKGAAITKILTSKDSTILEQDSWIAEVGFKEDGDIDGDIKLVDEAGTDAVETAKKGEIKYDGTKYTITITGNDLTTPAGGGAGGGTE